MNEKIVKILRILKYIVPAIILIIILFFLFCPAPNKTEDSTYKSLEKKLVDASKRYYQADYYQNEEFITLYMLSDQNLIDIDSYNKLNCNDSSGVAVSNNNFIPYLICPAYKSPTVKEVINQQNDRLKLKGNNPLIINTGTEYQDPGYESNEQVSVTGEVANEPGLYKIIYRLNDGTALERIVIVTDSDEGENINDQIKDGFELSLKGEQNIALIKGMSYTEMGATAFDAIDGDLTNKIETYGTVDTNNIGLYILTYRIRNSRGQVLSVTRNVEIEPPETEDLTIVSKISPQTPTNQNVKINLTISGNDYSYTILPNGNRSYTKNIEYTASTNGTYTFKVYPQYGTFYEEKVTVSNIDKNAPEGSCYATSSLSQTDINVISSTKQKQTYSYSIGGAYSDYTTANNYTFKSKATMASVRIKDEAGNIKTITCKIETPKFDSDKPIVYIYNTHQYENYKDTSKPSGVLKAARYMRDLLVEAGVPTIVEEGNITKALWERKTESKYAVSKKFIKAAKKKYPSLSFFIDLHRDSTSRTTTINGKSCAVYFFLIGGANPNYKKNLSVAKAINKAITKKYPTLARDIMIRGSLSPNSPKYLFNQTMGKYFVLIELGGHKHKYSQAKNTLDLITPFIAEYVKNEFIK